MRENQEILLFNAKIDQMLGLDQSNSVQSTDIPSNSQVALTLATRLMTADFHPEIRPQPGLRARWNSQNSQATANPVDRKNRRLRLGWVWAALILLVLIASLLVFRQPVLAAVGRLFGYGYIPQVGFVQLDTALILHSPVKQEHAGRSLTVVSGLATPKDTTIWVEFSTEPTQPDGAWLETSSENKLALKNWFWDPDQPGSRGVRLVFPPLSTGMDQMTLAMPEGWRIPLEWIPAAQANIPSAEVIAPYPTLQLGGSSATAAVTNTQTPVASKTCVQVVSFQVCLKAATTDPGGTHVLLEAAGQGNQITPGAAPVLFAPNPLTNDLQVTLTDDLGNSVPYQPGEPFEPMQTENGTAFQTLTFPPVSRQARTLTLRAPAFEAHTMFSEPLPLRVDLGADPQPGQTLALDQELSILGQTVHFSQGILQGDGVSSLHLTLVSDPAGAASGLLVAGLDLGRPEGIDDGYGSSGVSPQGQVKVFTELIGPVSGKKTGVLTFPVLGARLLLLGPFEFTFPAPTPTLAAASATPQAVSGESFAPQPTPTPLPLEAYHYDGNAIPSGDLLFTVVGASTTDLFAFHPQGSTAPERIATLPGQVYQVFVHPDRLGIDYLAGNRVTEDNFTFYRSIQVYGLRFDDRGPHLLAAFPRGPENVKGTELTANWSYDGRFVIFALVNFYPQGGAATSRLGWIDLNCRETGNCQVKYLQFPDGVNLGQPQFSPSDYRVLMTGGYNNERSSYTYDLFMLEFDAQGKAGAIANLSNTPQIDELVTHWDSQTGRVIALCPSDPIDEHPKFCFYDPTTGLRQEGAEIDQHLFDYQVGPDGKRVLGIDINHQAADNDHLLEFRLFDWDGKSGPVLASAPGVNRFAESPDSRYFAYIVDQEERMHLVDIPNGKVLSVPGIDETSIVSWLGWVP